MALTRPTIVGVFDQPSLADTAIQALENAGFRSNQIYYSSRHTSSGGFLSGLKSLFTGEETGNVSDDLTGMGLTAEEATYYENEYQAGRAVVAVQGNSREQEAAQILQANGGRAYGTRSGATRTGSETGNAARTDRTLNERDDEARRLQLREEQLNVEKQRVQTGEVRLHKNVVEEQKILNIPVTHEEVYIERRAINGDAASDTTPIGEGEAIRIPVSEEQVNVNKQTVVTGEVTLNKQTVQETRHVSDTVRREEARVEQDGDAPVYDRTKNDRL